jgi:hypothetical protein
MQFIQQVFPITRGDKKFGLIHCVPLVSTFDSMLALLRQLASSD